MDNFIVSARKYRPATFDTVVGQKSITGTLKNAIRNNQLAQAFLFCGPRGIGKTTCARIFAKTINCENVNENIEPCNECESCTSFNNNASFNIHELDAASNNSVDDIRNLVDQVRIPPQVGKYKVYIIDEVHMLSQAAFNAFLKTLEEPPAYAKFILATTEKHKIIPTILSRCQIFDFKRIGVDDIAKHLAYVAEKENVTFEPNALHVIALKADGAMRDALSIFDQIVSFSGNNITYQNVIENLNVLDYDYFFKMTDFILGGDISNTLLLINEIIENGFDGQHYLIGMGNHLRNLLVCKDEATIKLLEIGDDFKERYREQSIKTSVPFLLKGLEINNMCDIQYKTSNNKRMHLELAQMQMCNISGKISQGEVEKKNYDAPQVKTETQEKEKPVYKKPGPEKTQPPEKPESKPVQKEIPATPGTISIKDAVNGKMKEDKEEVAEVEDESFKPTTPFTSEDLQKFWERYAHDITKNMPTFAVAMLKYKPGLFDKHTIIFKTDNKIIASDQINISELLGYLKKELNNYKIHIKTELTKKEENNKAYTDQEKFEHLAKKNPALKKLKNELDLEIEF